MTLTIKEKIGKITNAVKPINDNIEVIGNETKGTVTLKIDLDLVEKEEFNKFIEKFIPSLKGKYKKTGTLFTTTHLELTVDLKNDDLVEEFIAWMKQATEDKNLQEEKINSHITSIKNFVTTSYKDTATIEKETIPESNNQNGFEESISEKESYYVIKINLKDEEKDYINSIYEDISQRGHFIDKFMEKKEDNGSITFKAKIRGVTALSKYAEENNKLVQENNLLTTQLELNKDKLEKIAKKIKGANLIDSDYLMFDDINHLTNFQNTINTLTYPEVIFKPTYIVKKEKKDALAIYEINEGKDWKNGDEEGYSFDDKEAAEKCINANNKDGNNFKKAISYKLDLKTPETLYAWINYCRNQELITKTLNLSNQLYFQKINKNSTSVGIIQRGILQQINKNGLDSTVKTMLSNFEKQLDIDLKNFQKENDEIKRFLKLADDYTNEQKNKIDNLFKEILNDFNYKEAKLNVDNINKNSFLTSEQKNFIITYLSKNIKMDNGLFAHLNGLQEYNRISMENIKNASTYYTTYVKKDFEKSKFSLPYFTVKSTESLNKEMKKENEAISKFLSIEDEEFFQKLNTILSTRHEVNYFAYVDSVEDLCKDFSGAKDIIINYCQENIKTSKDFEIHLKNIFKSNNKKLQNDRVQEPIVKRSKKENEKDIEIKILKSEVENLKNKLGENKKDQNEENKLIINNDNKNEVGTNNFELINELKNRNKKVNNEEIIIEKKEEKNNENKKEEKKLIEENNENNLNNEDKIENNDLKLDNNENNDENNVEEIEEENNEDEIENNIIENNNEIQEENKVEENNEENNIIIDEEENNDKKKNIKNLSIKIEKKNNKTEEIEQEIRKPQWFELFVPKEEEDPLADYLESEDAKKVREEIENLEKIETINWDDLGGKFSTQFKNKTLSFEGLPQDLLNKMRQEDNFKTLVAYYDEILNKNQKTVCKIN